MVKKAEGSKYTYGTLKKVYDRGMGAYKTNPGSVRPNVTSPQQWALARVNSFLKGGHKQDDDLKEADGPCWDGYKQVGMKKKNGKDVPNCVPEETDLKEVLGANADQGDYIKDFEKSGIIHHNSQNSGYFPLRSVRQMTNVGFKNANVCKISRKCWVFQISIFRN